MYITIASLTINNNATTFTINSGEDISGISPNSILYVAGASLPTQVSWENGAPKLAEAWSENTFTAVKARIFVGIQGLVDAVDSAKAVSNNLNTKTDEVNTIIAGQGTAATKDVTTSLSDKSADKVTKVGDFGLGGGLIGDSIADFNDVKATGFYLTGNSGLTNLPPNLPTNTRYTLFQGGNTDASYAFQYLMDAGQGLGTSNKIWYRRQRNPGSWSDWVELLHSGYLNFNELSPDSSGDIVFGNCVGRSSNIAWCFREINSFIAPTSITVEGTFSLYNAGNGVVRSGISAADIILEVSTTPTNLLIGIRNTPGITVGENYTLRADSSTSKITVNY